MRSSINRKITLNSVLVVMIALVILFLAMTAILNRSMNSSFESQLQTENAAAYKVAFSNVLIKRNNNQNAENQLEIYESLSDSINVELRYNETDDEYTFISGDDESFMVPDNIDAIARELVEDTEFKEIEVDGITYLATAAVQDKSFFLQNKLVVISFLSMEELNQITRQYIIILFLVLFVLLIITTVVSMLLSGRITKPLEEVIKVTEKYAENDFSESYISDTNDEIEDLSRSVSSMGNKLKEYNAEREKTFRYIAHEVKTPLTAIYGYAEGIKRGIYNDNDEALDIIMKESIRIKELTEDVILLSKLEANIEAFDFKPNDISTCVERAIKNIESIAILNDIDIVYVPNQIDDFVFDDDKIYRAVLNLLSNCIKYTVDEINIRIKDTDQEVTVTISDNGKGFDDKTIESLKSGICRESNNGSGIGLSIVSEIINAHKGKFTISNDNGAVFRIILNKNQMT